MQGFSLFKVVLLCDVTSNTMLFLLKSKGTAIYYIFISKPKKKKKKLRGPDGLRSLSKSHILKNGSTKILILEVRIDSMQHFCPFFWFVCWFVCLWSLFGRYGADAVFSIQWFCFYSLMCCCRSKDLSPLVDERGRGRPLLDFWCMVEPPCQSVALWLRGVRGCVKYKPIISDEFQLQCLEGSCWTMWWHCTIDVV